MLVWKAAFVLTLATIPGFASADDDDAVDKGIAIDDAKATAAQLSKLHAKMDANRDKKLSETEILYFVHQTDLSIAKKEAAALMKENDGDKDGVLSMTEMLESYLEQAGEEENKSAREKFEAREVAKFLAADANGDHQLDVKEFSFFLKPEVHDGVLETVTQHALEDHDEDKDGSLTIDELWGKLEAGDERSEEDLQTFKQLDTDGSGKLNTTELMWWQSGRIHKKQHVERFMELADTDDDQSVSKYELQDVTDLKRDASDKWHGHLMKMIRHHEL